LVLNIWCLQAALAVAAVLVVLVVAVAVALVVILNQFLQQT
jgi:hypothetical protein